MRTAVSRHLPLWFLLPLLAGSGIAAAATLTGSVAEAGTPLADVQLLLADANNVILRKAYTDAAGHFRFTVEPGTFNVGAFKADYSIQWVKGVRVDADDVDIRFDLVDKAFAEDYSGAADGDCE
jgi:hypothetical protein